LNDDVSALLQEAPTMQRSTVAKAEKFLLALDTGRALTSAQTQWVTLMRSRNKLLESDLKRSITARASTAASRQPVLSGWTVKQTRKKATGREVVVQLNIVPDTHICMVRPIAGMRL
jgi:hypothetical protein